MPTFLDNRTWDIAKDVLTALAILKAIISVYRRPHFKKLACGVILDEHLSRFDVQALSNIQNIQKQPSNRSIIHGHVLLIKLTNSGHLPITSADHVQPISISFGVQAEVLTAQIVDEHPLDLSASIRVRKHSVQLDPLLLNPNDSLTIEIIVNADDPRVAINCRIVGIRKISSRVPTPIQDAVILFGLSLILVGIVLSDYIKVLPNLSNALAVIGVLIVVAIPRLYLPLRKDHLKEQVEKRHRQLAPKGGPPKEGRG